MMKKKLICTFLILFSIFITSYAFEYNGSLNLTYIPQNNTFCASIQNDFFFYTCQNYKIGAILELGWGISKFTMFGSNAIVYGYMFCPGFKVQFRVIDNLYIDGDMKLSIIYPTFPIVLWSEMGVGCTYYVKQHFFVRALPSILICEDAVKFKGTLSCGIRY